MKNEFINGMEHAYTLISQANKEMIDLWVKDTFLGWRWWVGVALTIIPWVIWIILRKRESTNRLFFAALFVVIVSSWLDVIGVLFGLWSYYYNVVPLSPAFVPWDFTLLPVFVMALLQIKPKIHPVLKGIAFAVFSSFIAEPIFVWIGVYYQKHWQYYYSFPIECVIYLIAHWMSRWKHFEKLDS